MAVGTVGALLSSQYAPLVINAGIGGVAALKDAISPNRAQELQQEVISGLRDLREVSQRQARGDFTPQEREQLRASAQPQLQQVAGTVASRGLGSSPAGAQIAAQAEQQVFSDAQSRAMQMEQIVNRDAFNIAESLAQRDASFYEDLAGIARAIQMIRSLGGEPNPQAMGGVGKAFGMASPGEEGYQQFGLHNST